MERKILSRNFLPAAQRDSIYRFFLTSSCRRSRRALNTRRFGLGFPLRTIRQNYMSSGSRTRMRCAPLASKRWGFFRKAWGFERTMWFLRLGAELGV